MNEYVYHLHPQRPCMINYIGDDSICKTVVIVILIIVVRSDFSLPIKRN